jgi:hypothetical protein
MQVSRVTKGILIVALSLAFMFSLSVPVSAASFDGVYNYVYNLRGPNGWEEHRINSGFLVRGGVISSNPSALSGRVDASGTVRFTGPCPYGDPQAVFTGSIRSDGTGSGRYSCPYKHSGSWAVGLVSRSGGHSGSDSSGLISAIDGVVAWLSGIGSALHLTDDQFFNAGIGGAIVIVVFCIFIALIQGLAASGKRGRRAATSGPGTLVTKGSYEAHIPSPPTQSHEIPPSTVSIPPGPPEGGPTAGAPPANAAATPSGASGVAVAATVLGVVGGALDAAAGLLVLAGGTLIGSGAVKQHAGEAAIGASQVGAMLGVAALVLAVAALGIVGATMVRKKPVAAAVLMFIAGVANLPAGGPGAVPGGMLLLAAVLALVAGRRAKTRPIPTGA